MTDGPSRTIGRPPVEAIGQRLAFDVIHATLGLAIGLAVLLLVLDGLVANRVSGIRSRTAHHRYPVVLGPLLRCKGRFLDDSSGSVERAPDPDLLAAFEPAAPHQAAVLAEELPLAVHLAVELEAAIPNAAVLVVSDIGAGL
jgi:hypothetical protein